MSSSLGNCETLTFTPGTVVPQGSDAALLSRQTHCKRGHEFTPKHEREPRVAVTRRT